MKRKVVKCATDEETSAKKMSNSSRNAGLKYEKRKKLINNSPINKKIRASPSKSSQRLRNLKSDSSKLIPQSLKDSKSNKVDHKIIVALKQSPVQCEVAGKSSNKSDLVKHNSKNKENIQRVTRSRVKLSSSSCSESKTLNNLVSINKKNQIEIPKHNYCKRRDRSSTTYCRTINKRKVTKVLPSSQKLRRNCSGRRDLQTRKTCYNCPSLPTSTPNDISKRQQKLSSKFLNGTFSPPKVSPVQRFEDFNGCVPGSVIASPSDLGSPSLQRKSSRSTSSLLNLMKSGGENVKIKSRSTKATPRNKSNDGVNRMMTKLSSVMLQDTHSTIEAAGSHDDLSNVNKRTKVMHENNNKNVTSNTSSKTAKTAKSKKKTVSTKSKDKENVSSSLIHKNRKGRKFNVAPDNFHEAKKDFQLEPEVDLKLFEECLPLKEKKSKKPSPPQAKGTCKIVDVDTSILDIDKTYQPSSLSQTTGSFSKKAKGRYSTSRLEAWAKQKNEEFENFDSYELSVD